jgi:hypothetical protein
MGQRGAKPACLCMRTLNWPMRFISAWTFGCLQLACEGRWQWCGFMCLACHANCHWICSSYQHHLVAVLSTARPAPDTMYDWMHQWCMWFIFSDVHGLLCRRLSITPRCKDIIVLCTCKVYNWQCWPNMNWSVKWAVNVWVWSVCSNDLEY